MVVCEAMKTINKKRFDRPSSLLTISILLLFLFLRSWPTLLKPQICHFKPSFPETIFFRMQPFRIALLIVAVVTSVVALPVPARREVSSTLSRSYLYHSILKDSDFRCYFPSSLKAGDSQSTRSWSLSIGRLAQSSSSRWYSHLSQSGICYNQWIQCHKK